MTKMVNFYQAEKKNIFKTLEYKNLLKVILLVFIIFALILIQKI